LFLAYFFHNACLFRCWYSFKGCLLYLTLHLWKEKPTKHKWQNAFLPFLSKTKKKYLIVSKNQTLNTRPAVSLFRKSLLMIVKLASQYFTNFSRVTKKKQFSGLCKLNLNLCFKFMPKHLSEFRKFYPKPRCTRRPKIWQFNHQLLCWNPSTPSIFIVDFLL